MSKTYPTPLPAQNTQQQFDYKPCRQRQSEPDNSVEKDIFGLGFGAGGFLSRSNHEKTGVGEHYRRDRYCHVYQRKSNDIVDQTQKLVPATFVCCHILAAGRNQWLPERVCERHCGQQEYRKNQKESGSSCEFFISGHILFILTAKG